MDAIEMVVKVGARPQKDKSWLMSPQEIDLFEALIRADEREACAKVCDRVVGGTDPDDIHSDSQWAAFSLAQAIRARNKE
jgi:hypothetical protein